MVAAAARPRRPRAARRSSRRSVRRPRPEQRPRASARPRQAVRSHSSAPRKVPARWAPASRRPVPLRYTRRRAQHRRIARRRSHWTSKRMLRRRAQAIGSSFHTPVREPSRSNASTIADACCARKWLSARICFDCRQSEHPDTIVPCPDTSALCGTRRIPDESFASRPIRLDPRIHHASQNGFV